MKRSKKWLKAMSSTKHKELLSASLKGVPKSGAKAEKGSPSHARAVHCYLESPDGEIYKIDNITAFVREHEELFPDDSVRWVSKGGRNPSSFSCNASHGLAQVNSGHKGSWRGWTLSSRYKYNKSKI